MGLIMEDRNEKLYRKYINFRNKNSRLITFIDVILVGIIASVLLDKLFWIKYIGPIHYFMEIICIVLNMSIFFIVWNRYEYNPKSSKIIAFGFLATIIFDVLHIYYFEPLKLQDISIHNLEHRFSLVSRFIEVMIIFIASFSFKNIKVKTNKYINLVVSILLPIGASYIIVNYGHLFPKLYDEQGLTPEKIITEMVVTLLVLASLFRHKNKIKERGCISYSYLALTLIMMIPAEICFMLYNTYDSSLLVYGHVFRIIYAYCLYKSIFKGSIDYMYEELEVSRKRLKDILDAVPLGIQTYNRDLKLDFVNREFENLLAINKEEVIGLSYEEVQHVFKDIDNKTTNESVDRIINERMKGKNVIVTYRKKDNIGVKLNIHAKKIEEGYLLITKDAGKEQDINTLHIQTHTILNSMKSPAFICDNENIIISVNRSFRMLTGLNKEDLVGINLSLLNEKVNYCHQQLRKVNGDEGIASEELQGTFINMEGARKEVIINKSVILNIYGEIIGKISVLTDITELKEQQQKILNNEKLVLLGQMGATIVHETRNFLTTIKGCSQLIEASAIKSKVVEYAKKINVNTDEVNRIISDFLSLSKPTEIIMEEVAVCDLLRSMESTLKTSSLMKGVEIEFIYNIDERYILCDEVQIRQVILNLSKNAIEAMMGIFNSKLIIEAGIIEENNYIYIRVSDNGKGMSKETLAKIGTPFFTTKQSGTGLGLRVCYDIIKQHGGTIKVVSEEGVGTTFTITLPGLEDDEFEGYLIEP